MRLLCLSIVAAAFVVPTTLRAAEVDQSDKEEGSAAKVFSDDFEAPPYFVTHDLLEPVEGAGVDGGTALRATYVGNEQGSARIVRQYPLPESGVEYTLVYDVRFGEDFQFVRGGKLHGLGPSRPITGGRPMSAEGWSARVVFGREGTARTYLYNQDQPGTYGTSVTSEEFRFERGRYHAVSFHVKLNDPEEANGHAHIYVDGERVVAHDNVRFRGEDGDHTLIDRVLFSTFHGGSSPEWAPKDEDGDYTTVHADFDNFAVYRGRYVREGAGE